MNMHVQHAWPDKASIGPVGMLVSVIKLRRLGMRISRREMVDSAPIIGRLVYEDAPRTDGGMVQHDRTANLYHSSSDGTGRIVAPLFDPFVVKWDANGIVMRGYEINVEGTVATQHVQVWLVRPLNEAGRSP
jgi:hypothetical protein